MNQIKILLCSDSPLYTQSLSIAFKEHYAFKVVDNIKSAELINAALRIQPDVVLWKLDDAGLLYSISELRSRCPLVLLVLVVEDPNKFDMIQMLKSDIRGCLPSRLLPAQIVNSVEMIVHAGIVCLARLSPEHFNTALEAKESLDLDSLTVREREVLSLLSENCSNQEIAATLQLSESTVKTHLSNGFKKLKVRNRTEAMRILFNNDLNQQKPQQEGTR